MDKPAAHPAKLKADQNSHGTIKISIDTSTISDKGHEKSETIPQELLPAKERLYQHIDTLTSTLDTLRIAAGRPTIDDIKRRIEQEKKEKIARYMLMLKDLSSDDAINKIFSPAHTLNEYFIIYDNQAILDRFYISKKFSFFNYFDQRKKELFKTLQNLSIAKKRPPLHTRIQTDEKLPFVAKTNKQIDRRKILENTKEMIYVYIERFDKESEIYRVGDIIIQNIGEITFIKPYINNNELRIRSFLNRLSQASANWVGKNDKDEAYYIDLYEAVINFLHLYEIVANDVTKMFQEIIRTDLYDLADDKEALQKLKLTKALKQIINKRGQIKREVYSWIIRIISENMNLEFEPMVSIFRNLLYLDDHKNKYQKFPLITPQNDDFTIFYSFITPRIKNLQLR